LHASVASGRVEGGYRFVAPWIGGVGLTPYAAGQFTTFELPAYAESVVSGAGLFALAYAAKSVTDTRSELGLRTDTSFAMPDGVLTLRGRAARALRVPSAFGFHSPPRFSRSVALTRQLLNRRCATSRIGLGCTRCVISWFCDC
jgi:Autotransporter beta-domain